MRATRRKPANHPLHLFLSLITFGCWLPVWFVVALVGRRETVTVSDPEEFRGPYSYMTPNPPPWPPSWSAGDPQHVVYGGSHYRWNPYANRWDRTYG